MHRFLFLLMIALVFGGCQATTSQMDAPTKVDVVAPPSETPVPPTEAVPTVAPTEAPTPVPEPEGMIAFSQGYLSQKDALKVYDLADGGVRQVTDDQDIPIWEISWSPDGGRLVFTSGIMGFNFYSVSLDDSELTLLSEGGVSNFYAPFWSLDGEQVTVVKTNFFDEYRILTVNTDGSGEGVSYDVPITTQTKLMHFKWSPDGTQLVFAAYEEADQIYGLYILNADGSGMRVLVTSETQIKVPGWSPDGTMLVYEAGVDIFSISADGSGLTQLTTENGENSFPVWSPDGSLIAFYSDREGDGQRLYQMGPDGANQTMVLDLRTIGDVVNNLHWSPNGKYISVRKGEGLLIVDIEAGDIVGEIEAAFLVAWRP